MHGGPDRTRGTIRRAIRPVEDPLPSLRRVLRPLRPVLSPIYRRLRPAAPKSTAKPASPKSTAKPAAPKPTAKPAAPKSTAKPAAPRTGPNAENAWRYYHQLPPERRIGVLEGRHPRSRVLIVATGPSAKQVIPFDARLHDRYDVVVALNGSVAHVRHLDYFVSVESQAHLWDWYHHPVPEHVQRCVSESGLRLARESGRPDDQADRSLVHLRHQYEHPVDIRHYENAAGEQGLLVGPRGETRLGRGTVSLQAIHFASILGASEIHLIGADLHFRGPVQHFYGQNEYGTHEVDGKRYHALDVGARMNPVEVTVHPRSGRPVETTIHFRESAEYIDEVASTLLPGAGITLVDFSDGLLTVPVRADFVAWMERGELVPSADQPDDGRPRRVHAVEVALRPAEARDRDLVLEWANDPVTRAWSFHPEPIAADTHAAWYAARLADPDSRIWVGEVAGTPIGQVRAQRGADGRAEVGISVAAGERGKGYAGPLLRAGMAAAQVELDATRLVALVRPDNERSLRLFRGAGFADEATGERAGIECVVLAWESVGVASGATEAGGEPSPLRPAS